jgi:membrane protein DedA with SNARE-associated domain
LAADRSCTGRGIVAVGEGTPLFDWITGIVDSTGYLGIAALMLAENLFPPIPSELIMPLAGFVAARGELNVVLVIIAGTAGSLLGALFWYGIGRWVGARRLKAWTAKHGRWLTMAPDDLDQACHWFNQHGGVAVLVGRMVPAVRTLISVPAGLTDMPLGRFLLFSTIGTCGWTALLAMAGWLLEDKYQQVGGWLNPITNVIMGGLVLGYLYRLITFRPKQPA